MTATAPQMRILIIEDDRESADYLVKAFREVGYIADLASDGEEGLSMAETGDYDVLVVDRMLPKRDGLSLIGSLRDKGNRTPVLILSALGQVDDRIKGLRAGGDDYLPKPFALVELVARLEALLRRPVEARETLLRIGSLELDLLVRRATRAGRDLELQSRELDILEYLVRRKGRTVTRSMLLQDVWGYRFEPRSNVVDVHMSKLRRKVDRPEDAPLIRNIRGEGYRIDEPG